MKTIEPKPIGKETFSIYWTIGTFLFVSFYLFKSDIIIQLGFFYVLFAVIINVSILLHEFFQACNDIPNSKYWISCLFILANIPIAIFYLALLFKIL